MKESFNVFIFALILPFSLVAILFACEKTDIKFGKNLSVNSEIKSARTAQYSNWTTTTVAHGGGIYLITDNIDLVIGYYLKYESAKWYIVKQDAELYGLKTTPFNTETDLINYIKNQFK